MGPFPYLTPKVLLPSLQEAARLGVTSVLEVGSHMGTTEPLHYHPRPSTRPVSFHPYSSYDLLIEDFLIPKTPHIYGTRMDTYLVVYF